MIKVVGFCDVVDKSHGDSDITYFREEDVFIMNVLPTREMLREYARAKGYYPSNKRGCSETKCDPIWRWIND